MGRNLVSIINLSITTTTSTTHSAIMMTKTLLLLTVASVLLSGVVCNVVSDIQVFTDYDELAAMDPEVDPEDVVTRVEISNDRALETQEPADRYRYFLQNIYYSFKNSLKILSRTIVCQISSQLKCGTACNGQACTATCTGTCGFLLPRYSGIQGQNLDNIILFQNCVLHLLCCCCFNLHIWINNEHYF